MSVSMAPGPCGLDANRSVAQSCCSARQILSVLPGCHIHRAWAGGSRRCTNSSPARWARCRCLACLPTVAASALRCGWCWRQPSWSCRFAPDWLHHPPAARIPNRAIAPGFRRATPLFRRIGIRFAAGYSGGAPPGPGQRTPIRQTPRPDQRASRTARRSGHAVRAPNRSAVGHRGAMPAWQSQRAAGRRWRWRVAGCAACAASEIPPGPGNHAPAGRGSRVFRY